jgi:hypothetical protein
MITLFAKGLVILLLDVGCLALILVSVLYFCVFQTIIKEERDAESNAITFDNASYDERTF